VCRDVGLHRFAADIQPPSEFVRSIMINAIGDLHRDLRLGKRPEDWVNVRIEAAKRRRQLDLQKTEKQPTQHSCPERGWYA
jgi:hypothetical protein